MGRFPASTFRSSPRLPPTTVVLSAPPARLLNGQLPTGTPPDQRNLHSPSLAIAAQAIMEGIAATTIPTSALVIALPEGPLDQDMESPTTSILSSPGAAPLTVPHPPTVLEGLPPSSLACTGMASPPTPTFPPSPPPVSAPPPAPLQSPQPVPKGRPKSKGSRAVAKY